MEKIRSEKKGQLIAPKCFRKNKNAHLPAYLRGPKKHNDGKFVNTNHYFAFKNFNLDYTSIAQATKHHKLKGWQKQHGRRRKAA